jgi:hypothetical protein
MLSRQQGSEALQAKDGKDPLGRAFIELAMQQKSPSDTSEESHSPGNLDPIPRWLFWGENTAKVLVVPVSNLSWRTGSAFLLVLLGTRWSTHQTRAFELAS